jgi:hypothetical protein
MCTDQAKVNYWRQESLPLPVDLIEDQRLVEILKEVLDLTDSVAWGALNLAAKHAVAVILNPESPEKADSKRMEDYMKSLGPLRDYWSVLEIPFRRFLESIYTGSEKDSVLKGWYWETIHIQVIRAYEKTIGQLNSPRTIRGMVEGKKILMQKLHGIRSKFKIQPQQEKEIA